MGMNFKEKLESILENEKFIEYSGTYSHDFLKKLFLQNISENVEIFINDTKGRLSEQEIWSFVNFLSSVFEDKKWEFRNEDIKKLYEYTKKWLYDSSTHDDVYKSLIKLFSFLPVKREDLIELGKYTLANRKAYTILEALSFDFSDLIPNEKIFLEVFLTTLNTPRGSYLGLAWHEKFWEIIAKHPEKKWFFDQLLIDNNKAAADEFLAKWRKASETLLNSLDGNQSTINEAITFFRNFFTKLSPERTWYWHESHNAKEFLEIVLEYAQKNNISLSKDFQFIFDEKTYWSTFDIISKFITKEDILFFHEKVWTNEMHLVRLYESLEFHKRTELVTYLKSLPWFQDSLNRALMAREKADKDMKESTRKFNNKIKWEIREWARYTKENEISPRLLEYFFRDDYNALFTQKYRKVAINQLKRFLDWNLFSLDKPVYQRVIEEDGKVDYLWWYWYSVEFFTNALKRAKELKINIKTRKIRSSIVRSLLLYNTFDLAKLYQFLERNITDKEADFLLDVLQKWHISNARYHLSGQNIFPVFEKYENIFLRKEHRAKVIELFKSIITDEDFEEWRRASPLDYIRWELRKDMLPWLKSHWENIVDKKRNYIETFDRFGLVLKLNTLLIQEYDDEAIRWRLHQFKSARVKSLSFDDRRRWQSGNLHFRWVSDIESELDFERTLMKWIEHIDAKNYQQDLLEIIKHALDLLTEEEWKQSKLLENYARYLISGVIWIFISSKTISVRAILDELNKINKESSGDAKYLFGFSLRNFKESKVKSLTSKEKEDLLYEIIEENNNLKYWQEPFQKENWAETWLPQKIIRVWTEWPSDKRNIENAWRALYPWKEMPFEVINGYCVGNLKELWNRGDIEENEIMILCFDFDHEWAIEWWNSFKKWWITEYIPEKCLTKKHQEQDKHAILLPIFSEIEQQVISDRKYLAPNNFQLVNACCSGQPKYTIELTFFAKWSESLFEKIPTYNWAYIWEYTGDSKSKQNFSLKVEYEATKKWILSKDVYKNFIPIFDKILEIIKKSK